VSRSSSIGPQDRGNQVDSAPLISVIITAFNEGDELRRTVESVQTSTRGPFEIIVVDDGSTDGSCDGLQGPSIRVLSHKQRCGVAASRNRGGNVARGAVVAFSDGHQRYSAECLDRCAQVALSRNAIVWPDVRGFDEATRLIHGADFRFAPETGRFTAAYLHAQPLARVSRITALRAPGYMMPRSLFQNMKWPAFLRGWGASEASVSLKAFFLGVPILHVCGPMTRHLFRKRFPYQVSSEDVDWNHAVITRVCFDERTWFEYWLPSVFSANLSTSNLRALDDPAIREEQREFERRKVRPDRDFWTRLLKRPEPPCLRTASFRSGARPFRLPVISPVPEN
jgi:glycosyltransferase involved in cell wall biosynthesis